MEDKIITGKILKLRGWPEGKIIGLAKAAGTTLMAQGMARAAVLDQLDAVRAAPGAHLGDALLGDLARECLRRTADETARIDDTLREQPLDYQVWGAEAIDSGAVQQMRNALRLPVAVAGALMPDAHVGYGLPIGGVLATQDAVIPYAVGVDIACFTGDTLIPLADGKDHNLRELAQAQEEFVVYACKPDGRVVAAKATAHQTRQNAPLVQVALDNGAVIRCTPDHRFMRRDGSYVEASRLQPGDSLMPFYVQEDKEGYTMIQQNYSGYWQRACRPAHSYNHKVVSVTPLPEREDVYCLNVPNYENFALSAGVFVHNCRMRLSIYDVSPHVLGQRKSQFEKALMEQTQFGMACKWPVSQRPEHEVLDDPDWKATRLLKSLLPKAHEQLGTSGTGNHFVEWGVVKLTQNSRDLGLEPGEYLALLSHSGSRGVGYKIANEYSRIAMQLHPRLENAVRHLAWLPLEGEAGQEYWLSMELAGRFASANHAVIHRRVAKAAGVKEIAHVENHHNFAWREALADGSEAIVHRKGATPAGAGVLGVIPGSMADPGYVVRGRGVPASINSASHGAGRQMGRKQATNSITRLMRDRYLQERGVTLLGGGLDEAPQAYKDIEMVIAAQSDLIEVVASFNPRIVRMADEPGDI